MPGTVTNLSELLKRLENEKEGFLIRTLNVNAPKGEKRTTYNTLEFCDLRSFCSRLAKYIKGNIIVEVDAWEVKYPFKMRELNQQELEEIYSDSTSV